MEVGIWWEAQLSKFHERSVDFLLARGWSVDLMKQHAALVSPFNLTGWNIPSIGCYFWDSHINIGMVRSLGFGWVWFY